MIISAFREGIFFSVEAV